MKTNPLLQLASFGQSVWLDFINRKMITSGDLQRLIESDGVCGMTSNPSIFEKAIGESNDYDARIRQLAREGMRPESIYETLMVEDVGMAADVFRPVFDKTNHLDGYVSIEVNPHLARDTDGTIEEAKRLYHEVNRPNIFVKVPATKEGLPAIRSLIAEGININITLLFGLTRYREVSHSYLQGLEDRIARKKPLTHIASVASFFLSRIDVLVDTLLGQKMQIDDSLTAEAKTLIGKTAIASAKKAYRMYQEMYRGGEFGKLASLGARPQRLLWASTGTKNPSYSDVKYIEPLIGPETISTMPIETLNAYRDHGDPASRIEDGLDEALKTLEDLREVGIDLDEATSRLEEEGIEKFNKPYDLLMETLRKKIAMSFE
jgi:transaldolase